MRMRLSFVVMAVVALAVACTTRTADTGRQDPYKSFSRFTDPGEYADMLVGLPDDVRGICEVARQQTVHHNLLPYHGVPKERWEVMPRVWPPKMPELLRTLKDTPPHALATNRPIEQRIVGACMLESHFLAGMLRYKGFPVRIRAGYFKDVRMNQEIVLDFWEHVSRAKRVEEELLKEYPDKWKEIMRGITQKQIDVNHYIEHWVCEYWDEGESRWKLLDANNTYLGASSGIDVGYHLPRKHFEYAFEAWNKMRKTPDFNADQYKEWPYDGRSHIRSQLLMDFFNLLNHDVAGEDQPTKDEWSFIKHRKYEELSPEELQELDGLAALLSRDPPTDELIAFYRRSSTIRIESAEKDRYSFLSRE